MIDTVKNGDGCVVAYIEWQVVDASGQFRTLGDYIYIQELWIHKDFKGGDTLKKLISKIDNNDLAKHAMYVYWNRDKYNGRLSKSFTREVAARKGANYGRKQSKHTSSSGTCTYTR